VLWRHTTSAGFRTLAIGVAGKAGSPLPAVVIIGQYWRGSSVSIISTPCCKANAQRTLGSRRAGRRGGVAVYLAAVNLDERKEKEGGVCALSDSLILAQEPSEHQIRVSLKK